MFWFLNSGFPQLQIFLPIFEAKPGHTTQPEEQAVYSSWQQGYENEQARDEGPIPSTAAGTTTRQWHSSLDPVLSGGKNNHFFLQ